MQFSFSFFANKQPSTFFCHCNKFPCLNLKKKVYSGSLNQALNRRPAKIISCIDHECRSILKDWERERERESLQHLYDALHPHKYAVLCFCQNPKECSPGPPTIITIAPLTDSRTLPAHSPLYAQTHPSDPGEKRHWLDKDPHHPPHPPLTPLGAVHLQSPISHPPADNQSPIRNKKLKATPHQEKSQQPAARPSTSTPANELSQIREMLQTLCNQQKIHKY